MPERNANEEPRVGIFWWFRGKLIIDSTPLSQAEPYGNALTHATGHIEFWTEQQKRGALPEDIEYEEPPRGRVNYDKRDERFFLRADRCILEASDVVRQLISALKLPPKRTSIGPDAHYRCTKCLSRCGQEDVS